MPEEAPGPKEAKPLSALWATLGGRRRRGRGRERWRKRRISR